MAREPRDMKPWTFYLGREQKDQVTDLAADATAESDRKIRASAVGRALVTLALADPTLVEKAKAAAIAEPPSGPSRRPAK